MQPVGKCDPGFYCLEGSTTPRPMETYAGLPDREVKLVAKLSSTATKYTLVGGGVCPTGHYCPAGTKKATDHPCPVGKYSLTRGLSTQDECHPCPEGFFCKSGTSTYLDSPCPKGHYCLEGTKSEEPCPAGKFTALERCVCVCVCVCPCKCTYVFALYPCMTG